MKDIRKRKGKIRISNELIDHRPDVVMHIMSKMIIIKAEYDLIKDIIMYEAYSEEFDKIENGQLVPEYNILVTENDENINLTIKRIK